MDAGFYTRTLHPKPSFYRKAFDSQPRMCVLCPVKSVCSQTLEFRA